MAASVTLHLAGVSGGITVDCQNAPIGVVSLEPAGSIAVFLHNTVRGGAYTITVRQPSAAPFAQIGWGFMPWAVPLAGRQLPQPPQAPNASLTMLFRVADVDSSGNPTQAIITPSERAAHDCKTAAVYTGESTSSLTAFESLAGRQIRTVMVFNNQCATWGNWIVPWMLSSNPSPDMDWRAWASTPGNQLVVTLEPFPTAGQYTDLSWLWGGNASQQYAATQLAQFLVTAGQPNAVIRLAHEANGPWSPYAVCAFTGSGSMPARPALTSSQLAQWVAMWRSIALAMRVVSPGFLFDWCLAVQPPYTPALASWYPGDDVVDIISADSYDDPALAWPQLWAQSAPVLEFALQHEKPFAFPEWGLQTRGDDPAYVNGINQIISSVPCAYQSYFYTGNWQTLLGSSPDSLAAYKQLPAGLPTVR